MWDIRWNLIGKAPDIAKAGMDGFKQGRTQGVLRALGKDPSDSNALAALYEVAPDTAFKFEQNRRQQMTADREQRDWEAKRQATDAIPDVLEGYGLGSGGVLGTPPSQSTTNVLAPRGAGNGGTDIVVPAPQKHRTIGDLYKLDSEVAGQLVPKITALKEEHRKQLADQADVMGRTAYRLLQLPPAQRQAALDARRDDLVRSGIAQHEIDDADLSDEGLHGYVTQSLDLKDSIAQHEREMQQAEVARHNQAMEGTARGNLALSRQREARVTKWGPQPVFGAIMPGGDGSDLDAKYGAQ